MGLWIKQDPYIEQYEQHDILLKFLEQELDVPLGNPTLEDVLNNPSLEIKDKCVGFISIATFNRNGHLFHSERSPGKSKQMESHIQGLIESYHSDRLDPIIVDFKKNVLDPKDSYGFSDIFYRIQIINSLEFIPKFQNIPGSDEYNKLWRHEIEKFLKQKEMIFVTFLGDSDLIDLKSTLIQFEQYYKEISYERQREQTERHLIQRQLENEKLKAEAEKQIEKNKMKQFLEL